MDVPKSCSVFVDDYDYIQNMKYKEQKNRDYER